MITRKPIDKVYKKYTHEVQTSYMTTRKPICIVYKEYTHEVPNAYIIIR